MTIAKKVIVGSNCGRLGAELCEKHDAIMTEVRRFPDGELYVKIPESVSGQSIVYFQSFYPGQNESLIESFLTIDTLFDLGAKKVEMFAPYFPYSRQDRRCSDGEAVSALTVTRMFKKLGIKKITSVNAHQFKREGTYNVSGIKFKNLNAAPIVLDFVRSGKSDVLVVLPDAGARSMIDSEDIVYFDKKRDDIFSGKASVSLNKDGDIKGRTVLILDDMISSGGTMLETCKKVLKMGAKDVTVSCVHGLFLGDCISRLKACGVKNIVSTNTVDSPFSKVSISPCLEDAL